MIETFAPMDEEASAGLRYRLRALPRIPLADLAGGEVVKVRGYVSTEATSIAPVTGAPCVVYALEWRELVLPIAPPSGALDRYWRYRSVEDALTFERPPLHLQVGGCDLLIQDGTAHALVRIDHAQIALLGVWKSSRVRDVARDAAGQPGGLLRSPAKLVPDDCIEHREALVEPGALLTILGRATYEADPVAPGPGTAAAATYRASHGQWVFAASAASPLFIVQELISSLDAVG